jgi:putative endopeptidase
MVKRGTVFRLTFAGKPTPMKLFRIVLPAALAAAVSFQCSETPVANTPATPGKDVFAGMIDSSANPAQDFFQFVNGGWLKKNPIPGSETGWGIGDLVQEEIYTRLRKISEDAVTAKAAEGTDTRKIGDFWSTGMDSDRATHMGLQPLQKELAEINAIKSSADVVKAMTDFEPLQTGMFYGGFSVGQDAKNSSVMVISLWQGGLGLPDRDYYFNTDDEAKMQRKEYVRHMAKMLRLVDLQSQGNAPKDSASYDKMAAKVMSFETNLAKKSRKLEDLRDPYANYNKFSVDDMTKKLTPSIDWRAVCAAQGITSADSMVVGQPEFFKALDASLKSTDVEVLKSYMRYMLVTAYADYLTEQIDNENFNFYGKILSGAGEQRPRWKRVLDAEEQSMGMVLGKLFVAEYFPEKTKERYVNLVEAIRSTYADRIKHLDWMSQPTKEKALDKLAKMTKKVGYPDKWKDYSALVVGTNSYCENMKNAAQWHFYDMISKFGKPVDRTEWDMTPQTYNAYYNPSNNEIVLPAAIFTIPGFADSLVDDAVVYGYAAASTIGHEITHGFDDEGRNFDAAGNLVNWWTSQDSANFEKRSFMMVRQFDAFEPLPGKHINGQATLGENIADYGGILLGLEAFKKTEQYKKGEKIGGFTPLQRYFMGYALGWLYQQRPENLSRRLMTDVHSPAKWRVNGPFANIPEFYEAFGVKEGDPMWRADSVRVSIW